MIYLYAITDHPEAPLPALPGLEQAPLHSLGYGKIAGVTSQLVVPDRASFPPTESNLWRHEAIVEALMDTRTVLPVSFGSLLTDEAALQAILATRNTDFVADLQRIIGKVELSVHVLWNEDDWEGDGVIPPHSSSTPLPSSDSPARGVATQEGPSVGTEHCGHTYMMNRVDAERSLYARRQMSEALAASIHDRLVHLSIESTSRILVTSHLILKASYLALREQVINFCVELERLRQANPHLHFLCTGPWPAYSFITPAKTANGNGITQSLMEALTRASSIQHFAFS